MLNNVKLGINISKISRKVEPYVRCQSNSLSREGLTIPGVILRVLQKLWDRFEITERTAITRRARENARLNGFAEASEREAFFHPPIPRLQTPPSLTLTFSALSIPPATIRTAGWLTRLWNSSLESEIRSFGSPASAKISLSGISG